MRDGGMRTRCHWRGGFAGAWILLSACGGADPSGPDERLRPGVVEVSLQGAQPDDGAVLIHIGAGATGVASGGSNTEIYSRLDDQAYTVLVFGPLAGNDLALVSVANVDALPAFDLREVSANDGVLRDGLSGYSLRVVVR